MPTGKGQPWGILAFIPALLLAGCFSPKALPPLELKPVRPLPPPTVAKKSSPTPAAASPRASRVEIGRSVQGRAIEASILGSGPDVTLLLATIHGDEPAGTPLLEELEKELRRDARLLSGRTVLLVPVANPDGYSRRTRANSRGVDLNRNFPAANWNAAGTHGSKPLSEPESKALHAFIQKHRPDRIVSVHQPVGCLDYDGPAKSLAVAMAKLSGLPVRKLGSRPGSLGSYAGKSLGLPIVTFELPRSASNLPRSRLWTLYGDAVLAAVGFGELSAPKL